MTENAFLTINNFAKLSRISTDALRYYDKIGILSPMLRGENNYRYYSSGQLAIVNVIRTLQALGISLDEIKELKDRRTPALADDVFSHQINEIDDKIEEWVRARKLLLTLQESIHSVLDIDEKAITVQFLPDTAIVLGDLNNYSGERNDYDALLSFYHSMNNKYPELDLNYSAWGIFSKERIRRGDWVWPDRYYFNNPDGNDKRPAALYAIGYTRGGYGQGGELYARLIDYIRKNGLEICGNAYEEYPLNEVCITNENDYLIRVMITVREKE